MFQNIYDAFDSFSDNQLKDISLGEKAKTIPSELGGITIVYSTLDQEMNATEEPETPLIDFGDEMSDRFKSWSCGQGKTCVGTKVKIVALKEDIFHRIALNDENILKGQVCINVVFCFHAVKAFMQTRCFTA